MLNYRLLNRAPWLAAAFCVGVALAAAPAIAQDEDKAKDKKPQPAAQPAQAAAPGTGVVLKPTPVDGSVSAYAAAVRKVDPNVKVYTNADLDSLWAGDTRAWATTPSLPTPPAELEATPESAPLGVDSLAWLEAQKAQSQNRARAIADAEAELLAAQEAVVNLEKQRLAISNPFAARPDLSPEEKTARADGDSIAARVARTEKELADARERVANAQATLNRARSSE